MSEPRCPDGCGKCCDPVVSMHAPNELAVLDHRLSDDAIADRRFMAEHCSPIPRREGLRRAGYLTDNAHTLMLARDDIFGGLHIVEAWSWFYECDRFDPETRRCTDYEHRPPMCRDYPLYGDLIDSENHARKALPEGCVYRPGAAQTPVKVLPPKAKRKTR